MDNGSNFGTDEVLMIGLTRLGYPQKFGLMVAVFGRDWTALCRAFNWLTCYIRTRFSHLITANLNWWRPELEYFSDCISKKITEKSDGGIVYPPGAVCLCGFIDDTIGKTCRPGGGPAEEGENAPRWNTLIQAAFYTGYKKLHGYKYQTFELPNGMCGDLYGPCPVRKNDLDLLNDSDINEKLRELSETAVKQYKAYCDGIFPILTHMTSKHVGEHTTRAQRYENGIMTKIRIGNEWAYGITENLFSLLKFSSGLRIRKNSEHAMYYITATVLRNAHCCLYGNQVSQYFNCLPPTLESYFAVE